MHRRHVALVGVNSRIGPAILDALLAAPHEQYHVYLFLRPTSRPPPVDSPRVTSITLPDPASTSDLLGAITEHGIEYVVSALSPAQLDLQKRLADACADKSSGVRRYILGDYGSCRSDDPYILDLLLNFRKKREVREHCMRLVEDGQAESESELEFSWTSLFTGHFFDWGLTSELLGFDVPKRRGIMFDGGKRHHWSASTTAQIGRAVVGVFDNLEKGTANRVLLVQSFRITQQEVLEILNELLPSSGKGKLEVKDVESRGYVKDRIDGAAKGEYDATEEMVAVLGITRSDWKGDKALANERLGLEEEDLREVIEQKLKDMGEI